MMDLKLGRRAFTLAVVTAPAACAPDGSLAQTPPRPQLQRPTQPGQRGAETGPLRKGPGDLAAISFRGATRAAAGELTLAHAFPPGILPANGRLELRFEGDRVGRPAQLKVLSRHADGSVRTALITVAVPSLPADRPRGALVSLIAGRAL